MTRLFRAFAAFWGLMIVSTGTPAIAAEGFSDTFQSHPVTGWHVADYTFSHPHFDTDWSRGQLRFENGVHLNLSPQANQTNRFTGASIRRENTTHYGRYEVVMKPARGVGVVTGFFTYTGAYYGTRHDEIDIEFLGKDTTRPQPRCWQKGSSAERASRFLLRLLQKPTCLRRTNGCDQAAIQKRRFEAHPQHQIPGR